MEILRMCKHVSGYCPICKFRNLKLTRHHKLKKYIWPELKNDEDNHIYICRTCHDNIEREITKRENKLLKEHPEIYLEVLDDFLTDKIIVN